ncbi:MAG: hypothetical protein PHQ74_02080 [Crocinitomicaceae bacterium]|nr:hypothetical protein [Crocinitomicaceae bacterium]
MHIRMLLLLSFLGTSYFNYAQENRESPISVESYYLKEINRIVFVIKNKSKNQTIVINNRQLINQPMNDSTYRAELCLIEPQPFYLMQPSKWGIINFKRIEPGEEYTLSADHPVDMKNYSALLYLDYTLIQFNNVTQFTKGIKDKDLIRYLKLNGLTLYNLAGYIRFKDENKGDSCIIKGVIEGLTEKDNFREF